MGPRIAMSSLIWAVTGFFIGAVIATLAGMINEWKWFSAVFASIGIGVGSIEVIRGKVGVPATALSGALLGWLIGSVFQEVWQLGAGLILGGTIGGGMLGYWLQGRFTRNTRREAGAGISDFYRR